jgi:hypothetical protein
MDGDQEDIPTDDGCHGIWLGIVYKGLLRGRRFVEYLVLLFCALMIETARTRSLVAGIALCI